MSHYRLKTQYNEEGSYGSVENHTVYAHHNLSCDYVTFYDEDGNVIISVPDTLANNLFEAMARLYHPWKDNQVLQEGVVHMTVEEMKKLKLL